MEQMYSMGVTIHSLGVMALIFSIVVNVVMLYEATDIETYKRKRSVVLLPLNSMLVAAVIFTGAIMMATKHLHFTLENIAMIILSVYLITKEIHRTKVLKHVDDEDEDTFLRYKEFAYKIMSVELGLIIIVSSWMWFFA